MPDYKPGNVKFSFTRLPVCSKHSAEHACHIEGEISLQHAPPHLVTMLPDFQASFIYCFTTHKSHIIVYIIISHYYSSSTTTKNVQ